MVHVVFKVCDYHHEFYRPENLCLLITGQVKPEDVFERIKSFEEKILSKVSYCEIFTKDLFLLTFYISVLSYYESCFHHLALFILDSSTGSKLFS
jgi:Zn-dependent M16 (insulinase) family peptidase